MSTFSTFSIRQQRHHGDQGRAGDELPGQVAGVKAGRPRQVLARDPLDLEGDVRVGRDAQRRPVARRQGHPALGGLRALTDVDFADEAGGDDEGRAVGQQRVLADPGEHEIAALALAEGDGGRVVGRELGHRTAPEREADPPTTGLPGRGVGLRHAPGT
ncbi:hypothetical protein OV079_14260 [Nannocystis pusilla]|uniref:Uncharacterized protein n=1 Tax=Nannocystis pusilla TaxID=889268 RepID=A0A9X3EW60_9BACT|nr:hypothetical protein [Nannocystis pusilla]MCY1006693.1 hypothetical protein [Nannocystis pusilla]